MAVKRWISVSAAALGVATLGVAVASATLWLPEDHLTVDATTSNGVTLLTLDAAVPLQGGPNPLITVTGPGELVLVSAVRPDVQTWAVQHGAQRVTALRDWESLGLSPETLSDVPVEADLDTDPSSEATEDAAATDVQTPAGDEDSAPAPDPRGLDLWHFETTAVGTLNIPGHGPDVQNLFLVASTGPEAGSLTITMTWPVEVETPLLWPGVAAGFLLLSISGMLWLHRRREESEQWVDMQLTGQIPLVDLTDEHSQLFSESLDLDQPSGWAPLTSPSLETADTESDSAASAQSLASATSPVSAHTPASAHSLASATSPVSAQTPASAHSSEDLPDDVDSAAFTPSSETAEELEDLTDSSDLSAQDDLDAPIAVPGFQLASDQEEEPADIQNQSGWWQQSVWGSSSEESQEQEPQEDGVDLDSAGEFGIRADFTGEIRQPNSEELDQEVLDYTQGGTPIYVDPVIWEAQDQDAQDVVVPTSEVAPQEVPLTETGILRLTRRQRRELEETGAIPILDAESYTPPTPLSAPSAPSMSSAASAPSALSAPSAAIAPSASSSAEEVSRISAHDAPSEPEKPMSRKERRIWETAQMAIIEVTTTGEIPVVPQEIPQPEPQAESDIPELGPSNWRDAWAIDPADQQEEER